MITQPLHKRVGISTYSPLVTFSEMQLHRTRNHTMLLIGQSRVVGDHGIRLTTLRVKESNPPTDRKTDHTDPPRTLLTSDRNKIVERAQRLCDIELRHEPLGRTGVGSGKSGEQIGHDNPETVPHQSLRILLDPRQPPELVVHHYHERVPHLTELERNPRRRYGHKVTHGNTLRGFGYTVRKVRPGDRHSNTTGAHPAIVWCLRDPSGDTVNRSVHTTVTVTPPDPSDRHPEALSALWPPGLFGERFT